ncbi:hypothetical protein Q2T70_20235 [Klebsiella oxytoca]|uniref:hypothetical protein n=1 Tax=Klebsiella oxytoca TaxID=571 RepID=UPI00265DA58A|nr:hypothetical protein [Klebsiella oxytoca]WKM70701.1 hypothetical protein Q2T70_20235 [Klebsiella oxytoca]
MTSKLTREQLHERARENVKALKMASRQTAFGSIRDELLADLQLAEYALAAMDSEPVAYIDKQWTLVYYVPPMSMGLKIGDKLYRHAQQPVAPATLPCSVELKPGLIIGKGCKTETLLTALRRRADYNADIDAMTPEERAEHDASIKAFKAMLAAAQHEVKS